MLRGIQCFDTGQGVNYDVVAEYNQKLVKIQVKTTEKQRLIHDHANPIYFFHLKRFGKSGKKNYELTDFDCYALVALDIRQVFYLKFDDKIPQNSICIRDRKIKYIGKATGGKLNGLYYQDLTWENLCQKL